MSYVHFDDHHGNGQLSGFRAALSAEVRVQTGEEFPIFQDRNDIAWGQNWQLRINETLDAVTLLIPIITPSFFRSQPCRDEVARFLERERRLGRDDLILPVYYISAPEIDVPARRARDELAVILAGRWYADWRELRFEPLTSPIVRRALALLASRLCETFDRAPTVPDGLAGPGEPPVRAAAASVAKPATTTQAGAAPADPAQAEATRAVATEPGSVGSVEVKGRREPRTHVVDAYHRGDHTTIGAAVAAAGPGERILVRPGLYSEGVVIDKPLELLGHGPVEDIVIQARDRDALLFKANIGRVANLTLRQIGGKGWFGVDIVQGRLELEGCDISSQSLSCVAIRDGADPRLRRNRIHSGAQSGVFVLDDGLGTLEDNEITGNSYSGVEIKTGGNPTLRRNRVHDNARSNVFIYDQGLGMLEDNEITGSYAGVEIRTGGNPTLRRNRIGQNSFAAVRVHQQGRGVLSDNDLRGNAGGAWHIADDCLENVRRTGNLE